MTTLHWESAGSGEPVLMIMGLGLSGGAWWRTVPVLSRALTVTPISSSLVFESVIVPDKIPFWEKQRAGRKNK